MSVGLYVGGLMMTVDICHIGQMMIVYSFLVTENVLTPGLLHAFLSV